MLPAEPESESFPVCNAAPSPLCPSGKINLHVIRRRAPCAPRSSRWLIPFVSWNHESGVAFTTRCCRR